MAGQGPSWRLGPMDPVHTDSHGSFQVFHHYLVLPNTSHIKNDPASPWNVKNWKENHFLPNNKKKPYNPQNYNLLELISELRSILSTQPVMSKRSLLIGSSLSVQVPPWSRAPWSGLALSHSQTKHLRSQAVYFS